MSYWDRIARLRIWQRRAAIYAGLLSVVCVVYAQTFRFGFVVLDDNMYVTDNPHVQQGLTRAGAAWAFTTGYFFNWHPLTWLSHMLDFELFGMDPAGHHATSVLIHAVNALLVFEMLRSLTGAWGKSALTALFFAAHPLRVESVAWIAERKDVLSALFGLLALLGYASYSRRPGALRYALVVFAFVCALMCKSMLVTLPCVMLLLDYWPLGRLECGQDRRSGRSGQKVAWLLVEKAPLFALSAGAGIVAMAVRTPITVGAEERVANALVSYVRYLWKTIWPLDLSVAYVQREWAWRQVACAGLLLASLTAVALLARRRKYLATGWLWFAGALFPAAGLVQISTHGMADRYTYLPSIGLFVALVWGVGDVVAGHRRAQTAGMAAALALALAWTGLSARQAGYWRNSFALFEHALEVEPRNAVVRCDLGNAFAAEGRFEEAVTAYRQALADDPEYAIGHNNLGMALTESGRLPDAVEAYGAAVRLAPDYANAYVNLGIALTELKRFEEAAAAYEAALTAEPEHPAALYNLAGVRMLERRFEEAAAAYERLLESDPGNARAHTNLGDALLELGRSAEAVAHYGAAIEIDPADLRARLGISRAKGRMRSE